MRKLLVVAATAVAAATLAACTSAGGAQPAPWESPVAQSSSSKIAVCTQIRDAFADAMGPLGNALGKMIGSRTAGDDDDADAAGDQVVDQLKSLSKSLKDLGAGADDTGVQQAVTTATANIDKLAADPEFLSDVKDLDDVPAAIGKLSTAAQPITQACS
ncbi:MAG TPA: hypothetical protein VKB69_08395 [Micromonosporaceae bacterium]|nr:hypothetical protein [Micromonosporaceae bacterium]